MILLLELTINSWMLMLHKRFKGLSYCYVCVCSSHLTYSVICSCAVIISNHIITCVIWWCVLSLKCHKEMFSFKVFFLDKKIIFVNFMNSPKNFFVEISVIWLPVDFGWWRRTFFRTFGAIWAFNFWSLPFLWSHIY